MGVSPETTVTALRAGMEARNVAAVLETFAEDAVLHSPLTDRLSFTGRDEIATLIPVLFAVFEELHYTDQVTSESTTFLVLRTTIAGRDLEIVDRLRFGASGTIVEFTAFFRPLPVATLALQRIGAGLGRQRSRPLGMFMATATSPLVAMAGAGDRMGARLIRTAMKRPHA
jgi:hypothetical protein